MLLGILYEHEVNVYTYMYTFLNAIVLQERMLLDQFEYIPDPESC